MYVDNDNQLAGKDATNYVIGLNHQKIAYICNDVDEMVTAERLSGYQQALSAANIAIDPTYIVAEDFKGTEYKQRLAALFLAEEHPTAVVASDDIVAMSLSNLLKDIGLFVPNDVSIISFNNSIFAQMIQPALTSIDIHIDYLSSQVVEKLVEFIEGRQTIAMKVILPHKIIERDSCKIRTE